LNFFAVELVEEEEGGGFPTLKLTPEVKVHKNK